MAKSISTLPTPTEESQVMAQTYQESMRNLTAIVATTPMQNGVVMVKPGQLTTVTMKAGDHLRVRKIISNGNTLQAPDNVVAVRHGDALHLRYADGSNASFEDFYSVCTDSTICSVNLAGDTDAGVTLSGANPSDGPVADDGLMVYAHGNRDVLMAMAQDQPSMQSALWGLADTPVVTYVPPDSHIGPIAIAALALAALVASNNSNNNDNGGTNGEPSSAGQTTALNTIRDAAQNDTATAATPALSVYTAALVTGVTAANLASINSALDSAAITGAQADTAPEVQAIVDAYNAILASADGRSGNTTVALTAAQYAAIGVTGVSGTSGPGTLLSLLDSAVDGSATTAVDAEPEVQALADAAARIIAAAGGSAAQAGAVTAADLAALGIGGVTAATLPAIRTAIQTSKPEDVDTQPELQHVVNTVLGTVGASLNVIAAAAEANNANDTTPAVTVYTAAAVSGVTASNLAAINSALDSVAINGAAADTTAEVQAIVDAYNAILASADGKSGNTTVPLTAAQYAAIGVTGVSSATGPGTALSLLDSTVDGSAATAVDTESEVQTLANAAAHIIAAAGGSNAQAGAVTLADLGALGIGGVTAATLPAIRTAIQTSKPEDVDTQPELQHVVNTVLGTVGAALNVIAAAAEANNANDTTPAATVYTAAAVSGVTTSNLAAINSALDSAAVNGAAADTTAEVQAIVDAYSAILASADGVANNTATPLTAAQYAAIGVTGVAGSVAAGTALFLLDNTVDSIPTIGVDTEAEVQFLADAAAHVIAAAGGTAAQASALTLVDLAALGITGVTASNLASVQAAVQAVISDTAVDTRAELQGLVNAAIGGGSAAALGIISAAAEADSATSTSPSLSVYAAAGVSGVTSANLAAINSALDTPAINGAAADTAPEVQAIVDAYNAILASADGVGGNTATPLTAAQYAAIGVSGVTGAVTPGTALFLLDGVVDAKSMADVDNAPEVQTLADAANHLMAAAGGTPAQIAALTVTDLTALGITGVTADLLPAVQAAIGAVTPDTGVDTVGEIQTVVNTAIANATNALSIISAAAQNNTATDTAPAASVYLAAGVSGVNAMDLPSINSALDSASVTGAQADTASEVQAIVNAYNAILASADGVAGNTTTPLTAAQYTAIGVTGVSGSAAAGTALFLLDNVVDGKPVSAVDTEAEVQALATAANHVMDAAGGTAAQIAALTLQDLIVLGVTGLNAATNLLAIQAAIGAVTPDAGVDTLVELQAIVNGASGGTSAALMAISNAAQNNTAVSSGLAAAVYTAAGVSGVTSTNQMAIDSALDSAAITGAQADTTPEVQAIVDAYNAILASADGVAGNTTTPLTGAQYAAIGVTGVSGTAAAGNAMFLLDNVVDGKPTTAVDTEAEVQALANAANHLMDAAGGTPVQIAALTAADLAALGVTGVTADNLPAVLAAIGATVPDSAIDTLGELQAIVNTAGTNAVNALNTIRDAAQNNTATDTTPAVSVYVAAGVSGVSAADLPSINSALDSAAVTGAQADTTAEVQGIVNAYNAILASADGTADNTATPLTGTQYTLVGVTGVSGTSAPGNALHLLDSVVDAAPMVAVDTVPELQAMADASAHVITGSAGGTAPNFGELLALGITGVTTTNLAAVQAGIAATADDGTGVDTRAELQAVVTAAISSSQVPHISSTLAGVSNLEVTSNLVLNSDQSVIVGTGQIHITDLGGPGYKGDVNTNTQTIDVATAVANNLLTITGTGANTHIVINPTWDLDLASNYQLSFDSGVFLDAAGSHAAVAVAPINFSTVTPGTHVSGMASSEAVASQTMVDATGALTAGKNWLNIEGIGNNTGGVTQLGDLSTGAYALVMKNYATTPGGAAGDSTDGIATHDTNVGVVNFGNNDIVYFDSQVNNSAIQFFDARYTGMTNGGSHGGLPGQNALVMGLTNTPQQSGSTAMILLGLEGNTANLIYPSVVTLDANTIGWANVWHNTNPPLIMG